MGHPKIDSLDADTYIAGELNSDISHEYLNGHIEVIIVASRRHNILCVTLASIFREYLKGSGCATYASDMKVKIKTQTDDKFYYPDVMVSCVQHPASEYCEENPVLIVEVLSNSTAMRDKPEKRDAYSNIQSLSEYILVAQDTADIEVMTSTEEGISYHKYSEGESIELKSINLTLAVIDVYKGMLT